MESRVGVGETLRETFAIYRAHAGVLLPVAFWLFLSVAVLEALFDESIALVSLALLALVLTFLYQGLVVGLVRNDRAGRRDSSIGELVRSVLPVLLPLVGVGLIGAIGIFFGTLLLVIPGLYLLVIWAVAAPAVVIERKGVFDALGRSRQLVRGHGWQVLWVMLVAVGIGFAADLLLTSLAAELADGPILEAVFYALSSTVTAPIEALVAAVLYFRLLELEPPPPPSGD
ncbi:MAG TPA: hypothetical protein VFU11_11890 [Solirubrobacterales bacterium]|nr:hypothetical protein [Solirubrobacterales bacterium]